MKTLLAVALALSFLGAWPGCAQSTVTPKDATDFDAALGQLAFQIAGPLEKEKVKWVIVADLLDVNGRSHPVGRFLADKLSAVLQRDYPSLETISFSQGQPVFPDDSDNRQPMWAFQETQKWAKKLGAKLVITGSFAKAPGGIGISLAATKTSGNQTSTQAHGVVPVSEEISAIISTDPFPQPKSAIARAGVGGVGVPSCVYCPIPQYTEQARAVKSQGRVVLQVEITADGQATNISVVKAAGLGLDEAAIEAVRSWRFRPALGRDGHPVATLVPIEVAFRLH